MGWPWLATLLFVDPESTLGNMLGKSQLYTVGCSSGHFAVLDPC
jgi:hypothetical protein